MPRRARTSKDPEHKAVSSTVVKALHVLDTLADLCEQNPLGASVSELSKRSDENPSSVCKHLAAFQQFGLVIQDEQTERYRIGVYALRLSTLSLQTMNVRDIASPHLHALAERFGETAHLVVRDGLRVVYIDKVEPKKTIRMHSYIGLRNPMYCTGVGKAILAYSPAALTDAVIAEGLIPFTGKTLTSKPALLADFERIRKHGYALDDNEHELEVRCIAAPIFDYTGKVAASVSLSGPTWRIPDDRLAQIGEAVREIALAISGGLGYAPRSAPAAVEEI